jgi:sugar O-acyltransferase (sialic acid O-acetyltransferase NeuD family)
MTANKEIIVLCAGGHARVVIDILRRSGQAPAALVDADPSLHNTKLDGVPIIGADASVLERDPNSVVLVNALGNAPKIRNSMLGPRRNLFETFDGKGYVFLKVCCPNAFVSEHTVLGEGCHIINGAIINPGCTVGVNSIINTGAQLDHDCEVGDHSHIGPGAILSGGVRVGRECHVGVGAVVTQSITIGDGAIVAAGAVVVKNVSPGATVFGCPATAAPV